MNDAAKNVDILSNLV